MEEKDKEVNLVVARRRRLALYLFLSLILVALIIWALVERLN